MASDSAPPTRAMAGPRAPGRRAPWFAAAASLVPAAALILVGLVLVEVREREARGEVQLLVDDEAERVAAAIEQAFAGLERQARERLAEEAPPDSASASSFVREHPDAPFRPRHGPPPTRDLDQDPRTAPRVDVATLERIKREHYSRGDPTAAARDFEALLARSASPLGAPRIRLALAGSLLQARRPQEAREQFAHITEFCPPELLVDGIPLHLSARLQVILLDHELGGETDSDAVSGLLASLDEGAIPLPVGQGGLYRDEVLRRLRPLLADPARWQEWERDTASLRRLEDEAHRWASLDAGAHRQWVEDEAAGPRLQLVVLDPSRLRAERVSRRAQELEPTTPGMRLSVRPWPLPALADGAATRAIPGLSSPRAVVVVPAESLIEQRVEPWRKAVWVGGSMVVAMALLAAGLAARSVRRSMEFAQLRSQTAAAISHELRTPLTALLLQLELLNDPRSADRAEHADRALQAGRRLSRLVDRVLQFSRSERGEALGPRERVAPEDLLHEAIDELREMLGTRRPEVTVAERTPAVVVHRETLRQVLVGLIENAIKYAPDGPLRLQARGVGGEVELVVEDQGPGVPAGERARIFEEFWRSPRHAEQIPGSGLGLSIAQRLVEAQGGGLRAEPAGGPPDREGLRLIVRLPADEENGP